MTDPVDAHAREKRPDRRVPGNISPAQQNQNVTYLSIPIKEVEAQKVAAAVALVHLATAASMVSAIQQRDQLDEDDQLLMGLLTDQIGLAQKSLGA